MPVYQIHRLKDAPRQQFRWAPHTPGVTIVKPKDYDKELAEEAPSPYALWLGLRDGDAALEVGDLLELESGELCVFKYIGFEEARWYVPEPARSADPSPVEVT